MGFIGRVDSHMGRGANLALTVYKTKQNKNPHNFPSRGKPEF